MSYTIHGFQQAVLVEYGCDTIDAFFLRWFADFVHTGKMQYIEEKGERFYWVNHDYFIRENPIVKITTPAVMGRRLRRLCKAKVLYSCSRKFHEGTKNFYRVNPKVYERLAFCTKLKSTVQTQPEINETELHSTQKFSAHSTQKFSAHCTQKCSNSSIKEILLSEDSEEREEKPKVENELLGKASRARSPQEEIYAEVFGEANYEKLTILQRQQLTLLDDLPHLRKTCQWWAGNNLLAKSIGRISDRYHETKQGGSQPSRAKPESVFDHNLRMLGIDPATLQQIQ